MTTQSDLMCPRCSETRLTEVVTTGQRRVAVCAMCCFEWPYDAVLCTCRAVPIPHAHPAVTGDPLFPICPRCGKAAQISKPA